eukprot:jgi/Ulvmu1/5665/UM024_0012.1
MNGAMLAWPQIWLNTEHRHGAAVHGLSAARDLHLAGSGQKHEPTRRLYRGLQAGVEAGAPSSSTWRWCTLSLQFMTAGCLPRGYYAADVCHRGAVMGTWVCK